MQSFKFRLNRITRTASVMDLRSDEETRKERCLKYAKKHKTCGKRAVFTIGDMPTCKTTTTRPNGSKKDMTHTLNFGFNAVTSLRRVFARRGGCAKAVPNAAHSFADGTKPVTMHRN